jgi:cytochrome P450
VHQFGFGSRTCVGRNLALVELHKFVGQFVRQFDAEFVNKEMPFKPRSQWFFVPEDMMVELKERSIVG